MLYCVCSDDLCFMFGVTLLSLDVGHAVFAQCRCALWRLSLSSRWRCRLSVSPPVRADPVSSGECGVDCGETEKGVPCRSRTHTRTTRSLSLSTDYTLHTLHTSTVYKVVTVFMHTHDTATADSITVSTLRAHQPSPTRETRLARALFLPTICENVCTRRARSHPLPTHVPTPPSLSCL